MASPFLPAGATTGDSGGELSSGDDSCDAESPPSPETEASRSLTELFEKAAVHLQGLIQVATREQLLYLYARYKQAPEKKGKEVNTGFGGPVVSSLYHEETIREEDKNIFDYCRENNIDHISKAIKSKNADVNMKDEEDNEGQTALHYAAACEFLEIVELLLQAGADPTLRDQDGCLPEEVTGCSAVCLVLQRHTASKA
ncbi:Acyl-CoA-binding domain-containing protein 6 [Tupaia chinensis]|uniref:Acyl-CoA-binding domain-containing protein 6 n=1 Tax=Tupaia chinensis TaxID=246437 RepID=L9L7A6_TUPCH|nr:Acyl-CoA-binding domain-containing protein 6 [Tupaia chinensis]